MSTTRKYPQSMTPPQLIALLDEMCSIGLAERRTRRVDNGSRDETFYRIALTDIYEAGLLLDKLNDFNEPMRGSVSK
jgi:hypothetical protein